jgi:hypothetical protein
MAIFFPHRLRSVSFICWLCLLAVWARPAQAQLKLKLSLLDQQLAGEQSAASASAGREAMSVQLGEPISIRLELTNTGNAPVELLPVLDPSLATTLFLVGPGGEVEPFTSLQWAIRDLYVKARQFAPNERLVYETFLFGRLLDNLELAYLFPEPGQYELYARYAVYAQDGSREPTMRLTSNRVRVTVGPALPGWAELKEAGVVDEVEGRSRSEQERVARMARLRELVAGLPPGPQSFWFSKMFRRGQPQERPPAERPAQADPKTVADVAAVLRAFLNAFAAGQPQVYSQFLSAGFLYNNGVTNRQRAVQEMAEDIQKLKGARLDIQPEIISVIPQGGDALVTARLTYRTPSTSEAHLYRITLGRHENAWLISRWDRVRE